jgi:hypothetical protein
MYLDEVLHAIKVVRGLLSSFKLAKKKIEKKIGAH